MHSAIDPQKSFERQWLTWGILLLAVTFFPSASAGQETEVANRVERLYILSFDSWGTLQNPGERDLAIQELRDHHEEIDRIIIFSYGWANDGRLTYATYRSLVDEISSNMPQDRPYRPQGAVIAVGWDSSQSGFRKLLNDLLPLPGLAGAIAWVPDRLFFPISFWSKAAQADRIGYGGLRRTLNEIFSIYDEIGKHPEIYLIGHSFGARIVSGLMVDRLPGVEAGVEPFRSIDHVRGAILLQPALVAANVKLDAPYPILMTMSRHDHAVGFMYPMGNLVLNSFGFTLFEAIIQKWLIRPVQTTTSALTGAVPAVVSSTLSSGVPQSLTEGIRDSAVVSESLRHGRRTLAETLALPLSFAFTLVVTPVEYVYIQTRGLLTHPVSHLMDSLAQIPVVELPVEGLSRLLRRKVPWGQRAKGIFNLGPINEGMGRLVTPRLFGLFDTPVYSLEEIAAMDSPPNGGFVVDATRIVSQGSFGLDLERPLVDATIGWIDPIGAHSDYRNPEVAALMSWLANSSPFEWPREV